MEVLERTPILCKQEYGIELMELMELSGRSTIGR